MTALYATITPHFTQDLRSPGLHVGYYDDGGVWQFVAPSLSLRLPLRAIEWRNLVGATKTIDRLPLHFVAHPEHQGRMPLVCIYVITCEDMERYRASVKQQITVWIDRMNAARVDWMLLFVPLGTKSRAGRNHSAYKKLFERIKTDFSYKKTTSGASGSGSGSGGSVGGGAGAGGGGATGLASGGGMGGGLSHGGVSGASTGSSGGAAGAMANLQHLGSSLSAMSGAGSSYGPSVDRICKIETLEGASVVGAQQHDAQWTELLVKLRRCIMEAFEGKCVQYEEEVRVLDAKRSLAGWDFGAFFVAKERLALMYQQAYLLDDATRHLDELEAIFLSLVQNSTRYFDETRLESSLAAHDPIFLKSPLAIDIPLLNQQIASNQASVLLMRLYFFLCQIRALYIQGDYCQLIERSITFIPSFQERLLQLHKNHHFNAGNEEGDTASAIEWFQAHQWAVGACLEIAYACELAWSGNDLEPVSVGARETPGDVIAPEVMARNLGDILYLARRILKTASKTGWWDMGSFPVRANTTNCIATTETERVDGNTNDDIAEAPGSWYLALKEMFHASSSASFQRCVWEVSHLASLHFSRAGRHRFAVFLGGECARYHIHHRELESASRLFRSQARQCEEDKWWELVNDCVSRICDAELALGRSAQAVAACFSMLEMAQAAKVQVNADYLDQLLTALVKSLREGGVESGVKMGQLIKPSITIETMQNGPESRDLDYGDVRVTLSLTNRFPAGILVEKIRIRFEKSSSSMVLNNAVNQTEDDVARSNSDGTGGASIELEESNVYLYERANVNLVFLYGDVDVGDYVCTGLECAIAGNTFALMSKVEVADVRICVPPRESTLQLHLEGPPLLSPATMEVIHVIIEANEDVVSNGILEITVPEDRGHGVLSVRHAQLESSPRATSEISLSRESDVLSTDELTGTNKQLLLSLPTLMTNTRVVCAVWVVVADVGGDIHDAGNANVHANWTSNETPARIATVSVCLRYDEASSGAPHVELRRAEQEFKILPPLAEVTRLQRVDQRVFMGIALTCNPLYSLRICDYALHGDGLLPEAEVTTEGANTALAPASKLHVVQDLNAPIRDCVLAPSETVHLAFVLRFDSSSDRPSVVEVEGSDSHVPTVPTPLPDKAVLRVSLEYQGNVAESKKWTTDCLIDIPLETINGPVYRVEVQPRSTTTKAGSMHPETRIGSAWPDTDDDVFAQGDDIAFNVIVTKVVGEINTCDGHQGGAVDANIPNTLLLCLDAVSDTEWILIGKQEELFTFSGTTIGGSTQGQTLHRPRSFTTVKRLMPMGVGRLRFPRFQLRVPPVITMPAVSSSSSSSLSPRHQKPQQPESRETRVMIPSERVHCRQSSRALVVI